MTADFDQDFAFSATRNAHDLVRRACYRLIPNCCGVSRATPADDRRGVDYWVTLPSGRRGLDLKLRRKDFGAVRGACVDCVIELESHGTGGWLLKDGAADLILFAMDDTHRVALFEATKLRTAVVLNLSRWLATGGARKIKTESSRNGAEWESVAIVVPADLLVEAIDSLGDCANDGGAA